MLYKRVLSQYKETGREVLAPEQGLHHRGLEMAELGFTLSLYWITLPANSTLQYNKYNYWSGTLIAHCSWESCMCLVLWWIWILQATTPLYWMGKGKGKEARWGQSGLFLLRSLKLQSYYILYCTAVQPQCTLHSAHYTVHTAQCTVHSAHYTVHTAQCTVHIAQCTLNSAH